MSTEATEGMHQVWTGPPHLTMLRLHSQAVALKRGYLAENRRHSLTWRQQIFIAGGVPANISSMLVARAATIVRNPLRADIKPKVRFRPIADTAARCHLLAMTVRIVQRPCGEAPEWVRDAWVGVSLPVKHKKSYAFHTVGVLSGPKGLLSQFWARISGRSTKVTGFVVSARTAIQILEAARPEAAAWWRESTPKMLKAGRSFLFDAASCETE